MSTMTWFLGESCPDPLVARLLSALTAGPAPRRPSAAALSPDAAAARPAWDSERPACPAPFPQWVG